MAILQDKGLTWTRLDDLWTRGDIPERRIDDGPFVVLSDFHMGDGSRADDFRRNERIVASLLDHYRSAGYTLVLLGDIEEFWLFDLDHIRMRYEDTIYYRIRAFGDERVVRIFGNHDMEWGLREDPAKNHGRLPAAASEGLRLVDEEGVPRMLLVHGHQGSRNADRGSWASRFFVRLFRPVKPMARRTRVYRSPSSTRSQITKDYERTFYEWAKSRGAIIVCGHTHRAIFASRSYAQRLRSELAGLMAEGAVLDRRTLDRRRRRLLRALEREREEDRDIETVDSSDPTPCYFNSGCALYPDGVTGIEIESGAIRLVKWGTDADNAVGYHIYEQAAIDQLFSCVEADSQVPIAP